MKNLLLEKLQAFQERRRFPDWQPTPPLADFQPPKDPELVDVLRRCASFVNLELAVGEWVTKAVAELPEVKEFVLRNAADEAKHDEAVAHLGAHLGVAYEALPSEVVSLCKEWDAQKPSFSLAYALEMGVFFSILPYLSKHGDMYAVKISNWISDDEVVHVLTNREIATSLGETLTKESLSLVARTVYYIFQPLGVEVARDKAAKALNRLRTGEDASLETESAVAIPAFFEQVNKNTVAYY